LFDFELLDLALELIDFGRHGIEFHAETGTGFVNQVDGFIGRKRSVCNDAKELLRQPARILDADTMMHFVTLLSPRRMASSLRRWLGDKDGLKTAFESGILFDVLAIFVESGLRRWRGSSPRASCGS